MLANVGLEFKAIPADIDETATIEELRNSGTAPEDIATQLAMEKALHVAHDKGEFLVIGSDQILEYDGQIFEKASDISAAKDKLKTLRGQTHRLISAVCIVQGAQVIWSAVDEASLTMHDFDDDFLDRYVESAADDVTTCVGGYALEKTGSWLFSDISGDYFTILGMPLLPLLAFLREGH